MKSGRVLAIDPGREKCGFAFVESADGECRLLQKGVIEVSEVVAVWSRCSLEAHELTLIVGKGTGSRPVMEALRAAGIECIAVDESNTTVRARALYHLYHPPQGVRRLIPTALLSPPGPIDDFAALVMARDWCARSVT